MFRHVAYAPSWVAGLQSACSKLHSSGSAGHLTNRPHRGCHQRVRAVVTASAHGFGISPATGKVVSDIVLHGKSTIDITGLALDRFSDLAPDWREERGWVTTRGRP